MKPFRNVSSLLFLLCLSTAAAADGSANSHRPDPFKFLDSSRFIVDVALDGRTWRLDDGFNPFYPTATFAFGRGDTFIVTGKIYKAGTLVAGGNFNELNNPPGPDLPDPIGEWVCSGTFNFDAVEIVGGAEPHVTSTQYFYFNDGTTIVVEGPEGGITPMVRAIVGGTGRARGADGEVIETSLGVNDTNLFNVRFRFKVD